MRSRRASTDCRAPEFWRQGRIVDVGRALGVICGLRASVRPLRSSRVALGAQSTVEYALVLAAFLALVVALGAMWHLMGDGVVVAHALQSASHHLQDVVYGAWGDVLLY